MTLCIVCNYWRASHGPLCESCATFLPTADNGPAGECSGLPTAADGPGRSTTTPPVVPAGTENATPRTNPQETTP